MEKGEGVTVNTKKAKELYAQAEKAGYAPAGPMLKALNDKEKPITIIGDLPAGVKDIDLYLMTEEDLLKYAQQGYLIPLREYCKQKLFFTYGTMWYNEAENKVVVDEKTTKKITDKEANEVLRLLESGATQDASCQFMLACLYSGMKCLGIKTDTTVFSYTDYNKAKAYLTKFQSNPKRKEADCFAQPQAVVEWISNNIKKL
jgi:TPR repeat protein